MKVLPLLKAKPSNDSSEILGCHVEGPFLCEKKKGISNLKIGAHEPNFIIAAGKTLADTSKTIERRVKETYGEDLSDIKWLTLAPELPGALDAIKYLTSHNIIVSCGHTNATTKQTEVGIEAGATLITHLYNAMSPFDHRGPGNRNN